MPYIGPFIIRIKPPWYGTDVGGVLLYLSAITTAILMFIGACQ